MKRFLRGTTPALTVCFALILLVSSLTWAGLPRNVIVMIGDGMGPEQVAAAAYFAYGKPGEAVGSGRTAKLSFERLPYQGRMTTHSVQPVTDSAAAATAIATGWKVTNGTISMRLPGNGENLPTMLEYFKGKGKRTGLITTTYMTHATPAGFGSHAASRNLAPTIAIGYLTRTRPNVLFGGIAHKGNGVNATAARKAGYTVVNTRKQLQELDKKKVTHVSGQFGWGHLPYEYDSKYAGDKRFETLPHLSEMSREALEILEKSPDGFFLMIEGGKIDHAGHDNHLQRNICETLEFEKTFDVVHKWARGRDDTLIIVTADHETGGLKVRENKGKGQWPVVTWAHKDHTATPVPIFAWGVNADKIQGVMDNTMLFEICTGVDPRKRTAVKAKKAAAR